MSNSKIICVLKCDICQINEAGMNDMKWLVRLQCELTVVNEDAIGFFCGIVHSVQHISVDGFHIVLLCIDTYRCLHVRQGIDRHDTHTIL